VVVAQDGSVSLAAIRWLAHLGIPYLHLDRDGRLIAGTTTAGLDDARLRRAQALATTSSTGLEISRTLIAEKIRGQQSNLARRAISSAR
jgi:CRISPR/Cas system-associated endonuclease Cas1